MGNSITKIIKGLVTAALLAAAFFAGTYFAANPDNAQNAKAMPAAALGMTPKVTASVVAAPTTTYVPVPVTEIQYVERVIREPAQFNNFNDMAEMEAWLAERLNTGVAILQQTNEIVDCDDYALELQQQGLNDGYIISFQIIDTNAYNKIFKLSALPADTLHAINLVIIGNGAYYIEPQTGEIVLAANID